MQEKLIHQIGRELATIYRCTLYIRDTQFRSLGLTKGQHHILSRVIENPGIDQSSIAQQARIDKSTAGKAIEKLISSGYLIRTKDESDGRMWRIYPTEKLIETYPIIYSSLISTFEFCTSEFTPDELVVFHSALIKYRKKTDALWESARTKNGMNEFSDKLNQEDN